MANETKRDNAVRRVKLSLKSLGMFARIRERLVSRRPTTPAGERTEQLEKMIRLNSDSADMVRVSLARAKNDLMKEIQPEVAGAR